MSWLPDELFVAAKKRAAEERRPLRDLHDARFVTIAGLRRVQALK